MVFHNHDNDIPKGKHARHVAPEINNDDTLFSPSKSQPQVSSNPNTATTSHSSTTRNSSPNRQSEAQTTNQKNARNQRVAQQTYTQPTLQRQTYAETQTDTSQYGRNSKNYQRKKSKKLRNGILIGIGVIIIAIIGYGAALGFSAINVKNQAPELMTTANALKADLKNEDSAAFVNDANKLNNQIESLQEEVNGPLWSIGSFIPVLGEDISAGQKLINVAADLSEEVLIPISGALNTYPLNTIYANGNINGDALNEFCNTLADASPIISQAAETVDSIPAVHIDQINQLTDKLRDPLNTASQFMSDNGDAFRLIPSILGCNGDRNYVIIAQNYSEARPAGGLMGSAIPLTVINGKMNFGDPVPVAAIRDAQQYPTEISNEESVLFDSSLFSASDVNAIPDWNRVGGIFANIWKTYTGSAVDGIIGIDVETFKRLVSLGSNTISLPDGTAINSTDLTKVLLHDTYTMFGNDGAMQDAYFAMVLGSCMDVIEGKLPDIGLQKIAKVIQQSIQEERLMIWMNNTEEEALMEQLGAAGTLSYDPKVPEIGVYFMDYTWSKIDWYLQPSVIVGKGIKNSDGTTSYPVTITATNTLTSSEAETLPAYVLGGNPSKRDISDMVTKFYFYGPAGGNISNIDVAGDSPFVLTPATLNGLEVQFGMMQLMAGQSDTITATVTVSKDAEEPLAIRAMQNAQSTARFEVQQ